MSLAGAPMGGGGGGDDLLAQIQMLLMQYLQQGPNTPVAPEASDLLAAIQQTGAGGAQAPMDAMAPAGPPDMGGDLPPAPGGGPGASDLPPEGEEAPTAKSGDSFKDARAGAKEFLKKKSKAS